MIGVDEAWRRALFLVCLQPTLAGCLALPLGRLVELFLLAELEFVCWAAAACGGDYLKSGSTACAFLHLVFPFPSCFIVDLDSARF